MSKPAPSEYPDFVFLRPAAAYRPRPTSVPGSLARAVSGAPALLNGHTVQPGAPFIGLDSCQWLLAVFPLADFLHQPFAKGRAFCPALHRERSGPSSEVSRGFTLVLLEKASDSWSFCRLSLMSRTAYSPLPMNPLTTSAAALVCLSGGKVRLGLRPRVRTVRAFAPSRFRKLSSLLSPLLTSAVRSGEITSVLSPDSGTNGRSPEVS